LLAERVETFDFPPALMGLKGFPPSAFRQVARNNGGYEEGKKCDPVLRI